MWARLDDENFVTELIDFDPVDRFHPDLIFVTVPNWFSPYINHEYWYVDGVFDDATGYNNLINIGKQEQITLFAQFFTKLDEKRVRPISTLLEANQLMALNTLTNSADNGLERQDDESENSVDNPLADINTDLAELKKLNALAALNRAEQKKLDDIIVPNPCTFAQAKNLVEQLKAIKPLAE